jgi:hypothetical protein
MTDIARALFVQRDIAYGPGGAFPRAVDMLTFLYELEEDGSIATLGRGLEVGRDAHVDKRTRTDRVSIVTTRVFHAGDVITRIMGMLVLQEKIPLRLPYDMERDKFSVIRADGVPGYAVWGSVDEEGNRIDDPRETRTGYGAGGLIPDYRTVQSDVEPRPQPNCVIRELADSRASTSAGVMPLNVAMVIIAFDDIAKGATLLASYGEAYAARMEAFATLDTRAWGQIPLTAAVLADMRARDGVIIAQPTRAQLAVQAALIRSWRAQIEGALTAAMAKARRPVHVGADPIDEDIDVPIVDEEDDVDAQIDDDDDDEDLGAPIAGSYLTPSQRKGTLRMVPLGEMERQGYRPQDADVARRLIANVTSETTRWDTISRLYTIEFEFFDVLKRDAVAPPMNFVRHDLRERDYVEYHMFTLAPTGSSRPPKLSMGLFRDLKDRKKGRPVRIRGLPTTDLARQKTHRFFNRTFALDVPPVRRSAPADDDVTAYFIAYRVAGQSVEMREVLALIFDKYRNLLRIAWAMYDAGTLEQ